MTDRAQWQKWAMELQALAQAGLFYGRDKFDLERYQRIRDIAAEMAALHTGLPLERVQDLFCNETGYQTPKLDTRAAIFQGEKILLVQESDLRWSLPGGWVDVDLSVGENTVKEVREEAGLEVTADFVIALQNRDLHNEPPYLYGICKVFVLCSLVGGSFQPNLETVDSGYFPLDALPPLSTNKVTEEQIKMCFDAYHADHWTTLLD
ncbi:NUDIX domain-containing protein [Pseudoflavonifractor sp. 60]|uniref:NUDIX hydrolase N-terminal domain-containing protein n=1 Tax=Pseudoflavonifractor sp. 60 TaxID=2304576 RepID=UPI0013689C7E|nr:NUDIX hydrolase [Pseudoflavonifractor sp. 60]NBI67396.1 NUDIX domain-containing protein [Pseudoflavonifractor sp. 60]